EPGGQVRIDWLEPARGSVKILGTAQPLVHPVGARLPSTAAEALDGRWLDPSAPRRAHDPQPPLEGPWYYTPLTFCGSTATVGERAALSRVADPSELRAARVGPSGGLGVGVGATRVTLRWRWAAEATATLVVARQATPPSGPNDPAALKTTVQRADYAQQ